MTAATDAQIRSKARVKDLAEVFTNPREVKAMLDLVGDVTHLPETTFLEPSCGSGNFLVEILDRKLATVFARHRRKEDAERAVLRSVMSIYAVDIDEMNVTESRSRLSKIVEERWSAIFKSPMSQDATMAVEAVLAHNIQMADFLKGRAECIMSEYIYLTGRYFLKDFSLNAPSATLRSRGPFTLAQLPTGIAATPPV